MKLTIVNNKVQIKDYIRTIPDFPKKGIMFRDVTTLFLNGEGLKLAINQMIKPYLDIKINKR